MVIQVDTLCHKIKGFVEKAGRAGVNRVFIGMETINPEALQGAQKHQNKIGEYRNMLQAWHGVGALTYAGYIIGFPNDTPESILRDIRIIQRELPIDLLEFFILTPLPGSQDHKELREKGVPMARDMNLYDTFHVTTAHASMSDEELQQAYYRTWEAYYTLEHLETVLHRAKVRGYDPWNMVMKMISFCAPPKFEKVHPLDGGLWRRKYRLDRRPGLPDREPHRLPHQVRAAYGPRVHPLRLVLLQLLEGLQAGDEGRQPRPRGHRPGTQQRDRRIEARSPHQRRPAQFGAGRRGGADGKFRRAINVNAKRRCGISGGEVRWPLRTRLRGTRAGTSRSR